jgi:hypothetical protein
VLKKEKNGLAAVFLIFTAMSIASTLIKKENDFNWYLIAGCLITLVIYFVLKYLKYKTDILNESGR